MSDSSVSCVNVPFLQLEIPSCPVFASVSSASFVLLLRPLSFPVRLSGWPYQLLDLARFVAAGPSVTEQELREVSSATPDFETEQLSTMLHRACSRINSIPPLSRLGPELREF